MKPFLYEPKNEGTFGVVQQGNEPIAGFADGVPFFDYENVVCFGDHTVSLFKPSEPFFIATDGVKVLSSNNMGGLFLFFLLERYKPDSEGYKRHYNLLKKQSAWLTWREEQQQIGIFFQQFDNLITLHQRKQNGH